MADISIDELDEVTSASATDYLATTVDIGGGVLVTKKIKYSNLISSGVEKVRGFIVQPNIIYANRPQIVMMRTDAAITVSRITIGLSTTAEDIECTMKYASNSKTFTDPVIISICDTTSGFFQITSGFTNANVPANKIVYLLFDAEPNADIKDFYIELFYTYS